MTDVIIEEEIRIERERRERARVRVKMEGRRERVRGEERSKPLRIFPPILLKKRLPRSDVHKEVKLTFDAPSDENKLIFYLSSFEVNAASLACCSVASVVSDSV